LESFISSQQRESSTSSQLTAFSILTKYVFHRRGAIRQSVRRFGIALLRGLQILNARSTRELHSRRLLTTTSSSKDDLTPSAECHLEGPAPRSADTMTSLDDSHSACEGSLIAQRAKQAKYDDLCTEDASTQEASPLAILPSNYPLSARVTLAADAHTCTPPDQSFQGKAQLDTTAANSDPNGITIIDPFITELLFQSPAYSLNRTKNAQRNLELTLPYRTSSANDAESSDDGEASNEYSCTAQTKTPDGRVSIIVISTDTGAPTNFIFRSALDRIGDFEEVPIPQRKLKEYTNPLDKNRKVVPQYFVRLPLYNRKLDLSERVRLKVFELSDGTNGFDIILGRTFLRDHGGHRFLAKVEEASLAEPRLASIGDNSFGALFESKKTNSMHYRTSKQKIDFADRLGVEQRLLDAQENSRFHEQNKATASNLYASSGLGSQSSSGGPWAGTTGLSQDPTARTAGTATWHPSPQPPNGLPFYQGTGAGQQRPDTWNPSAQQPNGSPFYHPTRAGQQRLDNWQPNGAPFYQGTAHQRPDHNAPLRDLQGDYASRRSNTNDSEATNFSGNTIFSSITRRTTASTISTCSSIPTTPTVAGKAAERAADYSVLESCASGDVPKQNNE
jgi:hypothetical protein